MPVEKLNREGETILREKLPITVAWNQGNCLKREDTTRVLSSVYCYCKMPSKISTISVKKLLNFTLSVLSYTNADSLYRYVIIIGYL